MKKSQDSLTEAFEPVSEIPPLLREEESFTRSLSTDDLKTLLEKCRENIGKVRRLLSLWEKYGLNSAPTLQKQNILLWLMQELPASQKEMAKDLTEMAKLLSPANLNKNQRKHIEKTSEAMIEVMGECSGQGERMAALTLDLIDGIKHWEEQRDSFLSALASGNPEPFFKAIEELGGSIIFDLCISQVIQTKILSALVDEKDRVFLVRLKKEINFIGSGPSPKLDLAKQKAEKRKSNAISKAKRGMLRKYYQKHLPVLKDPQEAECETIAWYEASSQLPLQQQQEAIAQFCQAVKKGAGKQT